MASSSKPPPRWLRAAAARTTLASFVPASGIESEHGLTFARGHRVEIEFDDKDWEAAQARTVSGACAAGRVELRLQK